MPHQFQDTEGRQYNIKVTIPRMRWIRDEIGVDLGRKDAFIALSANPIDLVNVIYMLVKDQADKYKLTDVQFGEAMDGDTLEQAWQAFSEAYLSFCPSHQAKLLRKLMAASEQTELLSVEEVEYKLGQLVGSYKSRSNAAPSLGVSQETTASGS